MMDQDGRIVRFGPFSGLSGSRRADTTLGAQQPTPMRGGYNVELNDGELWVRRGTDFEGGSRVVYASVPWTWVIEYTTSIQILASPWYAIYLRSDGKVSNITVPDIASEAITFDGTSTATSTSTLNVNDLIFVGTSAFAGSEVYRVMNVASTTVTLDRASTATGAENCRVLNCFMGAASLPSSGGYTSAGQRGHFAMMDQLVTHGAGDLYTSSPATTPGRYLIIAHQQLSDASLGPVAVPLNTSLDFLGGQHTNWFRDTSTSSPAVVNPYPKTCGIVDNRLVMAAAADPAGLYDERTIWTSWPGDFMLWHAGLGGSNAAPLYVTFDGISNPIQAVRADGSSLVVHREVSQEVGVPQGSASAPFAYRSNEQGLGMVGGRAIVEANRAHYIVTQAGPARFSADTGIQLLALEHRTTLKAMGLWDDCRFIAHDPAALRLYFIDPANGRHSKAALPATDTAVPVGSETGDTWTNTTTALVYDYGQNAWWLEDHINADGWGEVGGVRMYLCRPDGTVIQVDNYGATGLDPDDTTGTNVVDALVDLPWFELAGPGKRGKIKKMVLRLRAIDISEATVNQEIDDLWSSTSDTLHFGTVEVYTDYDMTTAADSMDMNGVVSTMRAYASSENNQLPILEFPLTGFRTSARSARIRIKNALSAAATSAGHKKGHFRVAYIDVWITGGEGDRPENPYGGT